MQTGPIAREAPFIYILSLTGMSINHIEDLTCQCSGYDEECSSDDSLHQAAYQGIVNTMRICTTSILFFNIHEH